MNRAALLGTLLIMSAGCSHAFGVKPGRFLSREIEVTPVANTPRVELDLVTPGQLRVRVFGEEMSSLSVTETHREQICWAEYVWWMEFADLLSMPAVLPMWLGLPVAILFVQPPNTPAHLVLYDFLGLFNPSLNCISIIPFMDLHIPCDETKLRAIAPSWKNTDGQVDLIFEDVARIRSLEPRAGQSVTIRLPSGTIRKTRTDSEGVAKLAVPKTGRVEVEVDGVKRLVYLGALHAEDG